MALSLFPSGCPSVFVLSFSKSLSHFLAAIPLCAFILSKGVLQQEQFVLKHMPN